jgi:hypothetical protein
MDVPGAMPGPPPAMPLARIEKRRLIVECAHGHQSIVGASVARTVVDWLEGVQMV